jgi:hypothetical protein
MNTVAGDASLANGPLAGIVVGSNDHDNPRRGRVLRRDRAEATN